MSRIRNELVLLLSAAGFLTRMPVPGWIGWAEDRIIRASRYFALVGALIGVCGGVVWWLGGLVLPQFAEMPGGWWAFLLAAGLTYGVTYLL